MTKDDNYVSIRIHINAKKALYDVLRPHETLSGAIIRLCQTSGEGHELHIKSDGDVWKQEIEDKIASLQDAVSALCADALIRPVEHVADCQEVTHTVSTGEKRIAITPDERGLYAAICKKGSEIEGTQAKLHEKLGLSSKSVIKNLVSVTKGISSIYSSDREKIIEFGSMNCPEILEGYEKL
jgi:ribosome-associated translation inhibitor RaiA